MIDRASAEISKCIMRLKRKDAKKPPEIPPKPVLNSTNNTSSGGNNSLVSSNNTNPFQQQSNNQMDTNGTGSGGSNSNNPFQNQMTTTATNKHGGIAVLPHHITTLSGCSSISMGSNGSTGHIGGIGSGNGIGPPGIGIGGIGVGGGLISINCTPTTPRKFPTLPKKTPIKHKKLISHHSQLWTDEDFLKTFFSKYFIGSEKLVLPIVCRKWRDVTYGMGRLFWGDLVPVLKCKELRGVRPDLNAGIRRRFYGGLVKRGFTSLKLHSATDDDAEDVIIHYSQGSSLVETLRISSSCLTDKGLFNLLDHLGNLQELELSSCNEITEEGLNAAIPKKLLRLVIYDCIHVADTSVTFVARNLTSLHCFEIQAYHVTDSALASFSPKCNSALSILKLNSCWELTNQTVLHIVSGLPQLRILSLSGCSKITDEGVEVLAENLNQLKTLDLSWCPRITDAALECIACDLACLEGLILDRCSLITDIGIGYLATMPSLKVLSLRWCSIRDAAIHHMISMKKLQFLSLAGCTSIAPSTLCSLSALRNLKELELTNCGVTPQVLHFLKNTLSCLIIE